MSLAWPDAHLLAATALHYRSGSHDKPVLRWVQEQPDITHVSAADSINPLNTVILSGEAAARVRQQQPSWNHGQPDGKNGQGAKPHDSFMATVQSVRELHKPDSDRSCLHVELNTQGDGPEASRHHTY